MYFPALELASEGWFGASETAADKSDLLARLKTRLLELADNGTDSTPSMIEDSVIEIWAAEDDCRLMQAAVECKRQWKAVAKCVGKTEEACEKRWIELCADRLKAENCTRLKRRRPQLQENQDLSLRVATQWYHENRCPADPRMKTLY